MWHSRQCRFVNCRSAGGSRHIAPGCLLPVKIGDPPKWVEYADRGPLHGAKSDTSIPELLPLDSEAPKQRRLSWRSCVRDCRVGWLCRSRLGKSRHRRRPLARLWRLGASSCLVLLRLRSYDGKWYRRLKSRRGKTTINTHATTGHSAKCHLCLLDANYLVSDGSHQLHYKQGGKPMVTSAYANSRRQLQAILRIAAIDVQRLRALQSCWLLTAVRSTIPLRQLS